MVETDRTIEHRIVEIVAPPKRLYPGARHRTMKTLADKAVWETAYEKVRVLQDLGWRIEDVEVLWTGRPGLEGKRLDWLRDVFGDVPITEGDSRGGRGRTRVRMVRDTRGLNEGRHWQTDAIGRDTITAVVRHDE